MIGRQIRTPRAAAVAGLMFSALLSVALVLVRVAIRATPSDAGAWLTNQTHRQAVLVALGLMPFAAIAFLWFIGVVRDHIGDQEDRFFATVFLGSGLLFLAGLLAAAVFMISPSTLLSHGGLAPRMLALSGYAIAATLLILVGTISWTELLFPAWVALVSLHILRRGHLYAPRAAAT